MKKNILLYIIITILACALTAAIVYIIINNNNEEVKEPNNNKEEENDNEEQITLSNKELEEYLSYVPKSNLASEFNCYETPSNINNLSEKVIIGNALRILTTNTNFDNISYTIEAFPEYSFDVRYSLSEVTELTLKMYNYKLDSINNVTSSDIGKGTYGSTEFIFDYYNGYFYGMMACSDCSNNHVSKIKEYNATEDELIIYEYGAYLESEMGDNHNTRLIDYQTKKEEPLLDDCLIEDSCNSKIEDFTLYKHTFKKNDTGYYWYSTEVAGEE